ncbi:MAG TPA: copper resistance protein CopC [Candidatus Thermoplasmatota archaeon]|nr:copper resistance protein CopC [Candidatus Thermoplasmatota archaeon]
MRRRWPSAAALPLLATLALLTVAQPVLAHADLDSSEPADGAQLATSPAWVVLRFSGPIEPEATDVQVVDEQHQRVDRDDLRVEDAGRSPVLNISLHDDLPEGVYLVHWKVLSDDGHPNSGRLGFAVGNATAPAPVSSTMEVDPAAGLGRALSYIGLAIAFGAAAWLWPVRAAEHGMARPAAKALALGALAHLVGAAVLFLTTAESAGVTAGVLASSQVGRMLILRLVAGLAGLVLAGLALVPGNRSRLGLPLAVGCLVVAAVASASIGHAAGEGLPGLAVDAMHLVASATWVGGLVLLVVALRLAGRQGRTADEVRGMGHRFGTVALVCVIILFLAGTATTFVILGRSAILDPLHLLETLYGRLLFAKVALAGLMVALAAANRFVFLDPAQETGLRGKMARFGPDGTGAGLRRAVLAETTVGLVILTLAGFLTTVSPTGHEGDAPATHDHAAMAAHLHSASLISWPWHGGAMMVHPMLAPLHEGHEGGSVFDAYNLVIGLVVLAILGVVGFILYKVAKRRRGE